MQKMKMVKPLASLASFWTGRKATSRTSSAPVASSERWGVPKRLSTRSNTRGNTRARPIAKGKREVARMPALHMLIRPMMAMTAMTVRPVLPSAEPAAVATGVISAERVSGVMWPTQTHEMPA
jgi:hypothetical protein